jgi:hypothetical protein
MLFDAHLFALVVVHGVLDNSYRSWAAQRPIMIVLRFQLWIWLLVKISLAGMFID